MNEQLDRNKTALTHVATATAAAWLDTLGCKPVETEVPVGSTWTADLATFWCPTFTEAKRSKLIDAIMPYKDKKHARETFDRLCRHYGGRLTIVVEVKVSRADFLGDNGRKYGVHPKRAMLEPPAHLLILAAPSGVVKDNESVTNWGRLRLSEDCSRVTKFDGGWWGNPQHPGQIEDVLAAIAVRRDHATRYASMRRWWRAYRITQAEARAEREERNRKFIERWAPEAPSTPPPTP